MIIENGRWTVYIHTNKFNGKIYVGVTSETKPWHRWGPDGSGYKGCIKFYSAIQKYGWDNFEHDIFANNLTKEEASNMEQILIQKLDTIANGYNIEPGGINQGPRSPEAIAKIKKARANQVFSDETRKKIGDHARGKKHSEEWNTNIKRGIRAVSRPVKCIETGEIFSCSQEASEKTGYSIKRIWASANRYDPLKKQRNRGLHFCYC